jgi:hypothetical protein
MKNIVKKILATIALISLVLITGLVSIIFSPQVLFAHSVEYKKFTVYYSESFDEPNFNIRLDDAYELIQQSELHDSNYHFEVFLAHNHIFNEIENLQGKGPIARATAGYFTIKVPIDPARNIALRPGSSADLTYLLAHEMIHNLQANKYGMINFSPIKQPPKWKLEGYPEYIAKRNTLKHPEYNFIHEIERYLKLQSEASDIYLEVKENVFLPFYYYKGRLMVEYLMDVKGLTYDQILQDTRSEDEIFNELLEWKGQRVK